VELDAIRRSDYVATVTEAEAALVRERVPDARTIVLPTVHELDDEPPLPFEGRRDLVFIGGFAHDPNVDAARHLVEEVMPLVWEEVDAKVFIIGSEPPPEVRRLASDRVIVTGYVPDPAPLFRRARAFVAPLRYGAGMKGKVGHALAFGLPVVTTTVGAEGMDLVDGEHVLVREGAGPFAAAVQAVCTDRALWQRLADGGRAVAAERWTPEHMRVRLVELLETVAPGASVRALARHSPGA
jgi:glycosyltransferase involved in cell wall biosynthesis